MMKKNGFVLTMQYNDSYFLPIWIRHYEKYFDHDSIYVIDHGSDRNFVPDSVNRIFVPRRKGFYEIDRLSMVQGIVFSLMKCYDFGVFCDSDELILLDTFCPDSMAPHSSIYTYGFDLFKVSVDGQMRIYGIFNNAVSKPLVFNHDYPAWCTGFHGVKLSSPPEISLIMGHLKYINKVVYEENFRNRRAAYDSMSPSEKAKGIAQQWNDPHHLTQVYSRVQQVISDTPLCNDIAQIPLSWTDVVNGCAMLKETETPIVMDLTKKFEDILNI